MDEDYGAWYNVYTKSPSEVEIGMRELQAQEDQGTLFESLMAQVPPYRFTAEL
jgi:hypothetical protein